MKTQDVFLSPLVFRFHQILQTEFSFSLAWFFHAFKFPKKAFNLLQYYMKS